MQLSAQQLSCIFVLQDGHTATYRLQFLQVEPLPKKMEQVGLFALHSPASGGPGIVKAEQVENAMDHVTSQFRGPRSSKPARLLHGYIQANKNLTMERVFER